MVPEALQPIAHELGMLNQAQSMLPPTPNCDHRATGGLVSHSNSNALNDVIHQRGSCNSGQAQNAQNDANTRTGSFGWQSNYTNTRCGAFVEDLNHIFIGSYWIIRIQLSSKKHNTCI